MATFDGFSLQLRRKTVALVVLAVALSALPLPGFAAEANGSSSNWFWKRDTDTGSNSWRVFAPTTLDAINWSSGPNNADGAPFPQVTDSQQKFIINPAGIAGRGFTPFSHTDTGARLSEAISSGTGSSTVQPGVFFGTNYFANWEVVADGKLGAPAPVNWDTVTRGTDPRFLMNLSEAGITDQRFDLFFEAGLVGASFSPSGGAGFNVSLTTAAGTLNLLDVQMTAAGPRVTNGNPTGLSIYLLTGMEEGPTENPARLVSLSAIETMLRNDLSSDRRLDSPLYLGFMPDSLLVPTSDMGNGAVGRIDIGVTANDRAADIPEPPLLGLLGAGVLGWIASRARNRWSRCSDGEKQAE